MVPDQRPPTTEGGRTPQTNHGPESPHPPPYLHERLGSIDLARGVAVVLMIAAHAADALLAGSWKHNDIWYDVNILFGFVAPAFIALSGLTLWPALARRGGGNAGDATVRPVAIRYLRILLLGYWIQIPVLSLRQLLFNRRPEELARLFDANILQVIAIAGLLVLALGWVLGSLQRARTAAVLAGIATVLLAPYLWTGTLYQDLPLPLRAYFSPSPPATFPLFPYLGYFMAGFAASPALMAAAGAARGRAIVLASAAGLIGLALALDPLLSALPPHNDFWGPGIQHFLFRLGGVVLLVGLSFQYGWLRPNGGAWLGFIGRHSLAIYLLHLMLVYGSPMTMGMRYWFDGALGGMLNPGITIGFIGAILLLSVAAVSSWKHLRQRHPAAALLLKRLWWALFWGLFLLQP